MRRQCMMSSSSQDLAYAASLSTTHFCLQSKVTHADNMTGRVYSTSFGDNNAKVQVAHNEGSINHYDAPGKSEALLGALNLDSKS